MPDNFIDTNIVIYSLGQDPQKHEKALLGLANKPVLSVQVLSETSNIMKRKLGYDIDAIRAVINRIAESCAILQPVTISTLNKAFDIAQRYQLSHYDSLIVAAALQANCSLLYSEDMQHGQIFDSQLKVVNPFILMPLGQD